MSNPTPKTLASKDIKAGTLYWSNEHLPCESIDGEDKFLIRLFFVGGFSPRVHDDAVGTAGHVRSWGAMPKYMVAWRLWDMPTEVPPAPESDSLLPCPFCGATIRLCLSGGFWYAQCEACEDAKAFKESHLAREWWNTRHKAPEPVEQDLWRSKYNNESAQRAQIAGELDAAVNELETTRTERNDLERTIDAVFVVLEGRDERGENEAHRVPPCGGRKVNAKQEAFAREYARDPRPCICSSCGLGIDKADVEVCRGCGLDNCGKCLEAFALEGMCPDCILNSEDDER